ncbi:hypothetical protein [Actinoplanes sp. M2I2]|uniref:hypothetical protein n=1 Tax=Actinoplanes sp. M2I2 TaxID=1734444 RepID=UPI00202217A2|nr:hypothetical protein [Actinoplanes sp. M2I2]
MGPHEMIAVGSSEAGTEEWSCPRCGRRLLLRWPPHFSRTVLHPGDDRVLHVGGRSETPRVTLSEAERLWLDEHGIAWS